LESPWKASDVDLRLEQSRVVIDITRSEGKTTCPANGASCKINDHAPQWQWRHLDTMAFQNHHSGT
jgi:hypothetical protein